MNVRQPVDELCAPPGAPAPPHLPEPQLDRPSSEVLKDSTNVRRESSDVASDSDHTTRTGRASSPPTSPATPQGGHCRLPAPPRAAAFTAAATKRKRKRKDTAPGVFREYISTKLAQDKAREEQEAGRAAASGAARGASGVTEDDVRRAMVNMLDAYAAKAQPSVTFC